MTFGDWAFDWTVGHKQEGLELRDVRWQGTKILFKASLPVIRVKYTGDARSIGSGDGPYQDRIHWGNLVVPRGAVGKVVSRSWDDRILEIAVFSQIGDYDIYHAYYFDRAGTMEGRVYSRGWSDEETHRHHPYWRLDFDVEHPRNLPRLIRRTRSEVRRVVRIVLEELNYWQSRADVEPFRFFISSPAGRHVGVRNVGNASRDAAPGAPWFSFSTKDSGVRLWKGAEDRGWEFGSRGHLGYASPPEAWTRGEWQSGKDVVLWMVHHLDHAWIEGEDEEGREWHWTTVQIIPEW